MNAFSDDPINEAILGERGIIGAVNALFEKNCIIPGVMMILCGIDIMANVDRPADNTDSFPDDFKSWADKYIRIPDDNFLTSDDLWEARNALLHTYGVYSKRGRSGKARKVIWLQNPIIPVWHSPHIDPNSIRVDPFVFKDAFIAGVTSFLCSALSDAAKNQLIKSRLEELVTYSRFIDGRLSSAK